MPQHLILKSHNLKCHAHFWPQLPNNYQTTSVLLNLYQHPKNQFITIYFFVNFRVPLPIFWPHPPQYFSIKLLISMNLYLHAKNQAVSPFCSRHSWLKNPAIWLARSILDHIYCFLVTCQLSKKQWDPPTPFIDISDQWILQSDWLGAFPAITPKKWFSQI